MSTNPIMKITQSFVNLFPWFIHYIYIDTYFDTYRLVVRYLHIILLVYIYKCQVIYSVARIYIKPTF